MNHIEAFNRTLFLQINGGDGTPARLIQVAIGIADDLIYLIPLLLLGMWLWGDSTRRSQAIKACLVTLLALGANQVIGLLWQHPRPFMIGLGHAWIPHAADSSFPSDHMTVFAGVGLTLLLDGALWFGLATLIGGLLWDRLGASFTFYAGATFCVVALGGLAWQPIMRMVKA